MSQALLKLIAKFNFLHFEAPFAAGGPERGPEHFMPKRHLALGYFCPEFLPRANLDWMFHPTQKYWPGAPVRTDLTIDECTTRGDLFIFIGAVNSSTLQKALANPAARIVIFDPNLAAVEQLVLQIGPEVIIKREIRLIVGDPVHFTTPVSHLLPPELFESGHPIIFVSDDLADAQPYVEELAEQMEFLFYRHKLYDISSQWGAKDYPKRAIARELFYDQQLHLFENIPQLVSNPGIEDIKNLFAGTTAILIAAGPDLPERIEYIRENAQKALLICVNSALPVLTRHGIEPHFIVINDNSLLSAKSLQSLAQCPRALLISHALSGCGKYDFPRILWFGDTHIDGIPDYEDLPLHGSVISTTFSLARHLGCKETIFVGAQLSSLNPWWLSYSKGTQQAGEFEEEKPLTYFYPQLYPVKTFDGRDVYTTLNFRDAALWLIDEIHMSDITAVNTSPHSILHSPRIPIDANAKIHHPVDAWSLITRCSFTPSNVRIRKILEFIDFEMKKWRSIIEATVKVKHTPDDTPGLMQELEGVIQAFDRANVSYLVQRYEDFNYTQFCEEFFSGENACRIKAARHMCATANAMSRTLLAALTKSLGTLQKTLGRS